MQRQATQRTSEDTKHAARFTPALDARKRKIRGLWVRNGKFYAQMRVDKGNGTTKPVRLPLDAATLDTAKAEAEEKRTEKRKGGLHLPGHRPKFEKLVEEYKASAAYLSKKPGTRENETQALDRWISHIGGIRIDWITTEAISTFHDLRKQDGVTERTINLDTIAFNNAMKYAMERKWLSAPPRLKKLKERPAKKRPLLSKSQLDSFLAAITPKTTKNAPLFKNYVRFLASTGAREQEALKVKKTDVDMHRQVVTVGAEGDTKNSRGREIQFNSSLSTLMTEMMPSLPPDTEWLFPSPRRGKTDRNANTLRESLRAVRKKAGMEWLGFHDFRHYFASACVMAGIDYMTIAKWLGHLDGGILVAKVYGHLNDQHQRDAAAKLTL